MNEASYDLVLVDADPEGGASTTSSTACGSSAPGGTVLVAHALWRRRASPTRRSATTP